MFSDWAIPVVGLVVIGIAIWALFFGALWYAIMHLMAWLGGWKRLAAHYAASQRPAEGKIYRAATIMVGMSRYRRNMTVIRTEEGLYIEPWRVFRSAHKPLFLPWSDLHDCQPTTLYFKAYIGFAIGNPVRGRMRLPAEMLIGSPAFNPT